MRTERRRRRFFRPLLLLLLLCAAALWFHWQCWGLQTTRAQMPVAGLPAGFEGCRIVHLSDLHGHEYGAGSESLLARVREAEPELIFLTGDLIDRAEQLTMVPALARGLAAIAPTYYVTGNHEWAVGEVSALKSLLTQCGVVVLSNEYALVERGGDRLVLAGVDDPNGYADQKTPEALYAELEAAFPGETALLLAHRSDRFAQYAAAGYDGVFSGHAHGGIVRLPLTDGLVGTNRNLFPTHTAGVYREGGSTLFVSRGAGNNTVNIPGFRLFNRPEVAVITLRSATIGA